MRIFSDGKIENEEDIIKKEYKEPKKKPFSKIFSTVKKKG
jgi:hypothetical protein